MNVSLTPTLESFVRDRVKTGLYNNASEVVREALRLMQECETYKEKQQKLFDELDKGYNDYLEGKSVEYTPGLIKAITQKAIANSKK